MFSLAILLFIFGHILGQNTRRNMKLKIQSGLKEGYFMNKRRKFVSVTPSEAPVFKAVVGPSEGEINDIKIKNDEGKVLSGL